MQSIDLQALTPGLVTGTGAGTVAGFVDTSGNARTIIRDALLTGTPAHEILELLASYSNFEQHQYSIADVNGFAVTYTGTITQANGTWFSGQAGRDGDIAYAVSGNLLTGAPVVDEAAAAIVATQGNVTDRLMAAMEAARSMGGDGRCSCAPNNPTGCGSPPASFVKSAHNGYMMLARLGDTSDCIDCTVGDFIMSLDVAGQVSSDPDPVIQLQTLYNEWRSFRKRRPDAAESTVTLTPPSLLPDGVSTTEMSITLLDINTQPIGVAIQSLTVTHAPGSDGICTIGAVVDHGGGTYGVTLTAGTTAGVDRFRITADDGTRAVILMPEPALSIGSPGVVENVRWSDRATLEWDAETAGVAYHLYGADLSALTCNFFGACQNGLDTVLTDLRLVYPDDPLPTEGVFFLITSVDAGGNEGPLGDSACGPRPNNSLCP